MDVLGSTGQVELNLFRTQMDKERQVRALASGLRVASASDDPSGLAISENLQTRIAGFQQGSQNAQDANNLLTVADGALAQVQQILSRIHNLIVESNSSINSTAQLSSIQTEIDQLLQEVNKIASSASFNGVKLLDGSLDNSFPAAPTVRMIGSPALPDGSTPTGSNVASYDGVSGPGPLVASYFGGTGAPTVPTVGTLPAYVSIRVIGYDANATDPDSGTFVGPADYVQIVAYSNSPAMGVAPLYIDTAAVAVNSGQLTTIQTSAPSGAPGSVLLEWSLSNLTAQDVGTSMTFETSAPNSTAPNPGTPLTVNVSGQEGDTVQIKLGAATTSALNIANISVMPSNYENFNDQIAGSASNQYAAADAEARVEFALDSISQTRAQLGAQSVSLQEGIDVAGIQAVNLQASESAIRDVNMGEAATAFTKDQVLSQIGLSVQAQMQSNARLVIQLVGSATPGLRGLI